MTEDEAKHRWCPFARVRAEDASGYNRWIDSAWNEHANSKCIGSACMAWRRLTVLIDRATLEPAQPGIAATGQLEERWSAEGYCGLAGSPQ